MTLATESEGRGELSAHARQRILSLPHEPLFLADWDNALMIHYEVDRDELQKVVPYKLDLWEGRTFVSAVAFTMRRMRPRVGGKPAEWLFKPISTHEFLNVRTYVRHRDESGIFFLAEWLSNRLSVALGPFSFGLPYRAGKIHYDHPATGNEFGGMVADVSGRGRFEYRANTTQAGNFESSGCTEWLMERYTAFTSSPNGTRRFFRVWHPPWPQTPVDVEIKDQSLLESNWPLFKSAQLIGGNFSPGVKNVWMGWPHKVKV